MNNYLYIPTLEEEEDINKVFDNINVLDRDKVVRVCVCSGGGDSGAFKLIAEAITGFKYEVMVTYAASAAVTMLAILEPEVIMAYEDTPFVIHPNNWGQGSSTHNMNAAVSKFGDRYGDSWLEGKIPQELIERARIQDVYFTADEAVEWGLIGCVIRPRGHKKATNTKISMTDTSFERLKVDKGQKPK